jgi:murein DD-endopeptidase MepM/ murein hydrolase activator NlpD
MRISAVAALMILTTLFLSGCDQPRNASIEDRGSYYYGRDGKLSKSKVAFTPTFGEVEQTESAELDSVTSSNLAPPVAQATAKPAATPMAMNSIKYVPLTPATPVAATTPALVQPAISPGQFQWPVNGKVIQGYGKLGNGVSNEGITIEAAEGTPIKAAQAGEVAYIGKNVQGYGNMIILRHANGDMTSYAHARTIAAHEGEQVAAGKVIAFVGTSGGVKTPQLHFAVREGDRTVDPLSKLPQQAVASN